MGRSCCLHFVFSGRPLPGYITEGLSPRSIIVRGATLCLSVLCRGLPPVVLYPGWVRASLEWASFGVGRFSHPNNYFVGHVTGSTKTGAGQSTLRYMCGVWDLTSSCCDVIMLHIKNVCVLVRDRCSPYMCLTCRSIWVSPQTCWAVHFCSPVSVCMPHGVVPLNNCPPRCIQALHLFCVLPISRFTMGNFYINPLRGKLG